MNSSTRTRRIATVLGTIGALLVMGASAQAATSRPAGMSQAAYESLAIRSQALDDKYGLSGRVATSRPAGMSKAAYQSLVIRSQALDDKYGPGRSQISRRAAPAQPTIVAQGGFVWTDFGIGAAAMLGAVLLAAGLIAGSRFGRRAPRTTVSS